jgi:hypothetical protein
MCWRRTNVYKDFFPALAAVVRDLPPGLIHPT